MNKKFYIIVIPLIIAGCGGENGSKENSSIKPATVNSSMVEVSEVVGAGKVEPETEIISLAASTGGVVSEIYMFDGDSIRKDQPLVRLDDELEMIRLAQLKSQYLSQKSQKDIDELTLRESELKLENKKKLLESVRTLVMKGAEKQQTLDDLETDVSVLALTVEKSRASVRLSEARLLEVSEQVSYAEAEASKKILRSPYTGILLELHVKKGSALNQFDSYAEVAPAGAIIVRTEVDELFATRLSNGLDAEIRFVGGDSIIAKGKVFFLSPYLKKKSLFSGKSNEQEDRLVREVRIKLDGDNRLILNSKVESVIKLKNR